MQPVDCHAPYRRTRAEGFTILELLVVMAVGATLLATAVIMARPGVATFRANGAMNDLKSQLHVARELAISRQRDILLTFEGTPARLEFRQANPGVDEDDYPLVGSVLLTGSMAFHKIDGAEPVSWCAVDNGNLNLATDLRFTAGTGMLVDAARHLVNGCFYVANPALTAATARALSLFGTTGRIGTFTWNGTAWAH